MPTGNITCATPGTTVPLCYGYALVTGMRAIDYTCGPDSTSAGTQIGAWLCGEGEWAGPQAVWLNGVLMQAFDFLGESLYINPAQGSSNGISSPTAAQIAADPGTLTFRFHAGTDAPLGGAATSGAPAYDGVGQTLDPLWTLIPTGLVTPLCFSRIAYYTMVWTPPGAYPSSATMQPVVQFATTKCRIFDADGNIVDYRFTTNPAWHFVDSWLRRAIKPEYAIEYPFFQYDITSDERSCFDWESIYESAAYFDQPVANGLPRFVHSAAYSSGTTLAAIHEEILLCCRSYQQEYAGKIYLNCDRPRPSTFLMTGNALVPGSFTKDDTQVHGNGNRYVASYLELAMPAVWDIESISRFGQIGTTPGVINITTTTPHAAVVGDMISIGGVDDESFDGSFTVTVTNPTAQTLQCATSQTANASSAGGAIGYIQSRFSQRSPELNHKRHQIATGQVLAPSVAGVRLKRTKVDYSFASCTFDQVNRLLKYEIYRDLGLDQDPYLPPQEITLNCWSEFIDANGNAAKAQLCGDVVTLDQSVFFEFAGEYEITQRTVYPFQQQVEQQGGSFVSTPDENSGQLQLGLRSFNRGVFFDTSDVANASFATVPGTALGAAWTTYPTVGFQVVSGTLVLANPTSYGGTATWTDIVVAVSSSGNVTYSGTAPAAAAQLYLVIATNTADPLQVVASPVGVLCVVAVFDLPALGETATIILGP